MNDDFLKQIEDVFSKVEPVDDKQRERIQALKEKMVESRSAMDRLIEQTKKSQQSLATQPLFDKSLATEAADIHRDMRAKMASAFDEQAEIIEGLCN